MRLGICGWIQSGKSTVFDVLAGGEFHERSSGRTRLGVGRVADERLDWIATLFKPKKVTHATVEYLDLPGLVTGPHAHDVNPGTLSEARQSDALVAVIRDFAAPDVPLPFGDRDPVRDWERLWDELVFADMEIAHRRIEKFENDVKKASLNRTENIAEIACLRKVSEALEEGRSIRSLDLSASEELTIRGFHFLTEKPLMVLLNRGEEAAGQDRTLGDEDFGRPTAAMFSKIELELDELSEEERPVFMEGMGLDHLAADEVVKKAFDMLGLVTFLTGGEKDCRAWTVPEGATAPAAAGTIHSDMERGFIRAQVVSYADLRELGSIKEARAHGKLRLEGKDYVVQDGDVVEFRFNV